MLLTQIPNLLTLVRIAACPVLVLLLHGGNYELALALFIAAGITDGLDGYIAKRFNCQSRLGAILDPVADKLLIGSAYIMLAVLGDIPFWLLILVLFRDMVIIVGYVILVMIGNGTQLSASYASKVNTVIQISLMIAVLLEKSGMPYISPISALLIIAVLVSTIFSGLQYAWLWGIRDQSGSDSSRSESS